MDIKQVTADFSVADQVNPVNLTEVKSMGFTTLICNRPDGEVEGQPAAAQLADMALSLGLDWHWIPVTPGRFTDAGIAQLRQALAKGGRTLAFCRTGTRSITLWSLSQAQHIPPSSLLALARQAGYDLQDIEARLQTIYRQQNTGEL